MRTPVLFLALSLAACDRPAQPVSTSASPPATPPPASASPTPPASASPTPPAAPGAAAAASDTFESSTGRVTVHPVYHATLWLEIANFVPGSHTKLVPHVVWVDPWSKGKLDGPKADVVLITDIHSDHFDEAGLAAVRKEGTIVVAPKVVAEKVPGAVVLANGEKKDLGFMNVEAVPMYNLVRGPAAGKLYHDKGRGNGYVLEAHGERVYLSGDTECTPEMKALTSIDVAFVCMNLPYTMTPAEAGQCIAAFKPKVLYPYHYRDSNLDELDKALAGSGVEVRRRSWY